MAEVGYLAVVVGDENHRARVEAEAGARTFNELYASEYLDRLRRGETGTATAYLSGLRHSSGADPWALLEVVAVKALAGHEAAGECGPCQDPVPAGSAHTAAPAAVTERKDSGDDAEYGAGAAGPVRPERDVGR